MYKQVDNFMTTSPIMSEKTTNTRQLVNTFSI